MLKNNNHSGNHYKNIARILLLILALNWLVALAKIIYGLLSRCSSMTADGFHSLSDGTSNIIGLIGIHYASRPVDKEHPYGHKKYETFFSLAIAAMLLVLSFNLLSRGIKHIYFPGLPYINTGSFLIMLFTLAVNITVMKYEYKKGRQLQSDILISDSLHTKADIFTSLSVIVSLISIKLGFPFMDGIVTIFISFFIAYAAVTIIKQSSRILCDTVAIIDERKISDIVLKINGVKSCHKIRSRGRADDIHLDLHVEVNPDMHIDKAHKISYEIEDTIKKNLPGITDVLVHMEPKEKKNLKFS
ncbi:MAG: cation diffusion facilitator family transporter [Candidatus Omnitrophota bacterium]